MTKKHRNFKQHRTRHSLLFRLLVPFIIITVVQSFLFSGLFIFTGVFKTLNHNEAGLLNEKLKYRQNYIQSEMSRWAFTADYANEIHDTTASVLALYQKNITELNQALDGSDSGNTLSEMILLSQCDGLVNYILRSTVNGVFIIMNDYLVGSTQHNGIYLRTNNNGSSTTSDLMVRIAPVAAKKYLNDTKKITDSSFDLRFKIDPLSPDSRFFYKPLEAATMELTRATPSENATDYGYWSRPFFINDKGNTILTYTIPLIYEGHAYGVMGIEITREYFLSIMPHLETDVSKLSCYFVGIQTANSDSIERLFVSGSLYTRALGNAAYITIKKSTEYENIYLIHSSKDYRVLGCVQYLRLYDANSPFKDEAWTIISLVNESDLFSFTNNIRTLFVILVIVGLFFGIAAALGTSVTISVPVLRLTNKIKATKIQERLTMDRCNIYEMDQLVDEIIKLSDRLVEVERAEKSRIEYERDYDVLTDLLNRRAFMRKIAQLENNPDQLKNAAMILLDMDGLKDINDNYGHSAGDAYLKAGARVLKYFLDHHALISRMGGDEFVVLFYGYEELPRLIRLIQRFRHEIKQETVCIEGEIFSVRFSAGLAWYPTDATNMEKLMKLADSAMYDVKRSGKNSLKEYIQRI